MTGNLEPNEDSQLIDDYIWQVDGNNKVDTGGCGVIFSAIHKLTDERHAIKYIKIVDSDPKYYERAAMNEITILNDLRHENIVNFNYTWVEEHSLLWMQNYGIEEKTKNRNKDEKHVYKFISMQFCENGNLNEWLKSKRDSISRQTILHVMNQAVVGLEYIHSKGIMHRDIKPNNIFIDSKHTVKIGDFGSATKIKVRDDVTANNSLESYTSVGTGEFMSPEKKNGKYNETADIYALGITFLVMLGYDKEQRYEIKSGNISKDDFEKYPREMAVIISMILDDPDSRISLKTVRELLIDIINDNSILPPLATQSKSFNSNRNLDLFAVADNSNPIFDVLKGDPNKIRLINSFIRKVAANLFKSDISPVMDFVKTDNEFMRLPSSEISNMFEKLTTDVQSLAKCYEEDKDLD